MGCRRRQARDDRESLKYTFHSEILKGPLRIRRVTPTNSGSTSKSPIASNMTRSKGPDPAGRQVLRKKTSFPKRLRVCGVAGDHRKCSPPRWAGGGLSGSRGACAEAVPGSEEAKREETSRKGDAPLLLRWPERSGEVCAIEFIISGTHSCDVFQERRGRLESTQCAQSKRERGASRAGEGREGVVLLLWQQMGMGGRESGLLVLGY